MVIVLQDDLERIFISQSFPATKNQFHDMLYESSLYPLSDSASTIPVFSDSCPPVIIMDPPGL